MGTPLCSGRSRAGDALAVAGTRLGVGAQGRSAVMLGVTVAVGCRSFGGEVAAAVQHLCGAPQLLGAPHRACVAGHPWERVQAG